MYSVLVVDDEKPIRQRIVRVVCDYFGRNADVMEAGDGQEALLVFGTAKFDIVITDIRMQRMDGLDFIGKVREGNSDAVFIIVSGYGDFTYAQRAIGYGVNQYLLKPVDDGELIKALHVAVEAVQSRQDARKLAEENKRNLLSIQHEQMKAFLQGDGPSGPGPAQDWQGMSLAVLVHEYAEGRQMPEMRGLMQGVAESAGSQLWLKTLALHDSSGRLVVVAGSGDAPGAADISDIHKRLAHVAEAHGVRRPITAVSSAGQQPAELPALYRQAVLAAAQRIAVLDNVILYSQVSALQSNPPLPLSRFTACRNAIDVGDKHAVNAAVDGIFTRDKLQGQSAAGIGRIYEGFVNYLIVHLFEENRDSWHGQDPRALFTLDIAGFQSIEELCLTVKRNCYSLCDVLQNIRATGDAGLVTVQKALNYICENLSREITMAEVANHVDVSYAHFSRLFKHVTGMSFVDYLTDLRIRRAKELLRDTALDIKDISLKLGYGSSRYFSSVFEKQTGMLPSVWRAKVGVDIRDKR